MNPLLIFDFDGTLVDTAEDIVAATNELLTELKIPPLSPEQVKINIGQGLSDLLYQLLPSTRNDVHFKDGLVTRFLEIYEKHLLRNPRLYDGVLEILQTWPHQKAILSNKAARHIHPILKQLKIADLPWVAVVGGDSFSTKKPDPQGLNHILLEAKTPIEQAVLIGDGNPDADLARKSGIKMIAVEFGYGEIDELMARGATTRLKSYHQLRKCLDGLFSKGGSGEEH
jgi:phosphoglycolate phosphatase